MLHCVLTRDRVAKTLGESEITSYHVHGQTLTAKAVPMACAPSSPRAL